MNTHQRIKAVMLPVTIAFAAVCANAAIAEPKIDKILATSQAKLKAGQRSQVRVNKLAEEASDLLGQYKLVNKDIEGLKVYNAQLEKQIEGQKQKLVDLEASISNITVLQRQIPPLAVRMLDALEQFVELDIPNQLDVRRDAIAKVRDNLDRADFSIAERFRQVLELYATEGEAGRKIETYAGSLELDGQEREVDFLAVGRVALMYQTKDTKLSGAWDQKRRAWVPLDAGAYRVPIREGIKIASKRASINVMQLPIIAPEAAQ